MGTAVDIAPKFKKICLPRTVGTIAALKFLPPRWRQAYVCRKEVTSKPLGREESTPQIFYAVYQDLSDNVLQKRAWVEPLSQSPLVLCKIV
jgi:hypothetical protein